jgi:hypothetical protein
MKLESQKTVRFEREELRALARRERRRFLAARFASLPPSALVVIGLAVGGALVALVRLSQWL